MCGKLDVGCHVAEGVGTVVGNAFEALFRQLSESALASLHSASTFWIRIDSPDLKTGGQNGGTIGFLQGQVVWVSGVIFGLAIIIGGLRMAWEQRAEPLKQLLKAMMTFALVSAAGSAALQLLAGFSDEFAVSIVESALPERESFEQAMQAATMQGSHTTVGQQLPMFVVAVCGVGVLLGSLVQIVLLLIRSAMLVLLAGMFPLAAVATNTEIGKAWFKKFCGWSLAFLAYKPAAALIYAAGIRMSHEGMFNQSGDGLVQTLTGMMMLGLAIAALPALLRFVVPLTAAAAGGSSGGGSAAADPGGLASGAVNVARSSGASGGGGAVSGGGASGGGASGAIGAAAGTAGVALAASKKAAGGIAGAASHSAGEAGGGSSSGSLGGSPGGSSGGGGSSSGVSSGGGGSSSGGSSGATSSSSGRSASGGSSGATSAGSGSSSSGGFSSGGGQSTPKPSGPRGSSNPPRSAPPPPPNSSSPPPPGPSGTW